MPVYTHMNESENHYSDDAVALVEAAVNSVINESLTDVGAKLDSTIGKAKSFVNNSVSGVKNFADDSQAFIAGYTAAQKEKAQKAKTERDLQRQRLINAGNREIKIQRDEAESKKSERDAVRNNKKAEAQYKADMKRYEYLSKKNKSSKLTDKERQEWADLRREFMYGTKRY